ncbi:MAG: FlgD immunoglobulin-like domain containing protein [candidate division Zixibacteria bacterium]|nr:FlgD immunoglobulin-like domain containing protein [candidate division Zixibacteria bacterium]
MARMFTWPLCLVVAMIMVSAANAQITVATNDFQPPVGTVVDYADANGVNMTLFNSVTSGSGGGFTWDFSALAYSAPVGGLSVDPAAAPATDSFPTATVVLRYIFANDTTWSFLRSTSSEFGDLGTVLHSAMNPEYVDVRALPVPEYSFPLDYQDSWTIVRDRVDSTEETFWTRYYDTTDYDIDAYGDVVYHGNSLPCLRIRSSRRITSVMYFNGLPFSTTLATTEKAEFVTHGFDIPVQVGYISTSGFDSFFGSVLHSFVNAPTDIRENDTGTLPNAFSIAQNYPNPFNPTTSIGFSLPAASHVRLVVYNSLGQEISVLADESLPAGSFTVDWDGTDHSGRRVASGVYFYRFETPQFSDTRKMLLLK